jgi:hypothetical protein
VLCDTYVGATMQLCAAQAFVCSRFGDIDEVCHLERLRGLGEQVLYTEPLDRSSAAAPHQVSVEIVSAMARSLGSADVSG